MKLSTVASARDPEPAFLFEKLVARILAGAGYLVSLNAIDANAGREVDIVAEAPDGTVKLIDVHYTAFPSVPLALLRKWGGFSAQLNVRGVDDPAILLVSGEPHAARKTWVEDSFGIRIWTRTDLLTLARQAGLLDELNAFFKKHDRQIPDTRPRDVARIAPEGGGETGFEDVAFDPPSKPRGKDLIERLDEVPRGKVGAKAYERLCQEILGYLFGDHLLDPRAQSRLEDDLSILDIVYRVDPRHHFWVTLTRDFRARVIVFECKNYTDPVTPMQVFTTERYMSVNALRPICFMLTRKPPHDHAELAAFGAMRESGKLLIFLSDEDLKQMLLVRDAQLAEEPGSALWDQNDPTVILDQKIYDFVARCPR